MQLFYRAGVDPRGRPVFILWAGHLPARAVDLDRVLMHIMRTLDPYAHSEFSIIYVHTKLSPENEPPVAWLRKMYGLFDRRLKENLYMMFIIQSSWYAQVCRLLGDLVLLGLVSLAFHDARVWSACAFGET